MEIDGVFLPPGSAVFDSTAQGRKEAGGHEEEE